MLFLFFRLSALAFCHQSEKDTDRTSEQLTFHTLFINEDLIPSSFSALRSVRFLSRCSVTEVSLNCFGSEKKGAVQEQSEGALRQVIAIQSTRFNS